MTTETAIKADNLRRAFLAQAARRKPAPTSIAFAAYGRAETGAAIFGPKGDQSLDGPSSVRVVIDPSTTPEDAAHILRAIAGRVEKMSLGDGGATQAA